jgi:hypothetical protein
MLLGVLLLQPPWLSRSPCRVLPRSPSVGVYALTLCPCAFLVCSWSDFPLSFPLGEIPRAGRIRFRSTVSAMGSRRCTGSTLIVASVAFTYEGRRLWGCSACRSGVRVAASASAGHGLVRALGRHLRVCNPAACGQVVTPRLEVVEGPHFFYVGKAVGSPLLAHAHAEVSALSPWAPVVAGSADTLAQHRFQLGAVGVEALTGVVRVVLENLCAAWPGYLVRGDQALVLQGGDQVQPSRLDWHTDRIGGPAVDSLFVIVPLSQAGRLFGLQAGSGLQVLQLEAEGLAVLSAGAYYCGVGQDGEANPALCFFVDRAAGVCGDAPAGSVPSILWEDLDLGSHLLYCCRESRVLSWRGLVQQLRLCFREGPAARRRRRRLRSQAE